MEIYLDNISTSKIDREVKKAMSAYFDEYYGNASSIHKFGIHASNGIEKARNIIASEINAQPEEIFFTSGGTEANNWAFKGLFFNNKRKGNHFIISSVEHPSIIETVNALKAQGAEATFLPVDNYGFICLEDLYRKIRKSTLLVSVMHVNNEIGTIEKIGKVAEICRLKNVLFHCDICQSFTKEKVDVVNQNIDMATLSAHKIYGPKGVGALYIKKGINFSPLLNGGGQEFGLRSGTYNTPAIVGFAKAVEISNIDDSIRIKKLRDYFIKRISNKIKNVRLNGSSGDERICNNINISIENISGKFLLTELNKRNIFISAGSACSSTKLTPSHVLLSIGQSETQANEAIRIGLSKWTTKTELDIAIINIIEIVNKKIAESNEIKKA